MVHGVNAGEGPLANSESAVEVLEGRALDQEAEITLGVLNAVQENSALTQRSVARELGIALGLANAYLKRCVKKGLIKVSQVPANRYAYYLTPKGFAEKSRLTAEYLSSSFGFFRTARLKCTEAFQTCVKNGWRNVALAGTGDLGEIATLCALEVPVTLAGIVDAAASGQRFAGLNIVASLSELGPIDAVLITDLRAPQDTYDRIAARFPADRILVPSFLRVSRTRPNLADE